MSFLSSRFQTGSAVAVLGSRNLQAGAIEAAVAGVPHFQTKSRSPGVRLADLRAPKAFIV